MMRTLSLTVALLGLGWLSTPSPAHAQLISSPGTHWGPEVQLWIEGGSDRFFPGDPLRLHLRASERSWVAVAHIDPTGRLEFLLPSTTGEDHYLFPGRTYTLPRGSATASWRLGPAQGIGYFFVVASPEPLDFRRFRSGARLVGGQVRGDPFLVMHELAEALRPRHARHSVDALSYRVGGGHSWPGYACWERTPHTGRFLVDVGYLRCDRLPMLLAMEARYYDPVRYRGDRARLFGRVVPPSHGSKHGSGATPGGRQARPAPPPATAAAESESQPRARPAPESSSAGESAGRGRPPP
jgi:hypothetical protein